MEKIIGHRDLVKFFAERLKKYSINYLLTGSFAVSYYGHPRATHDVDFVVEIKQIDSEKILKALKNLRDSFLIDPIQIKEAISSVSQFNLFHPETGIKVDFWIKGRDEFEKNKFKRIKVISIDRQKISLISAEDLILTKLLWCKTAKSERHLDDCRGILAVQKNKLNRRYLSIWLKRLKLEDSFEEISTEK